MSGTHTITTEELHEYQRAIWERNMLLRDSKAVLRSRWRAGRLVACEPTKASLKRLESAVKECEVTR